jgi:hypothetical protein
MQSTEMQCSILGMLDLLKVCISPIQGAVVGDIREH